MGQLEIPSFTIRPIHDVKELAEVSELEKVIWQSDDPVPVAHAITSVDNGGMVIGAFLGDKIIGFQYSFAGFNGINTYLCSYLLGVHPKYRIGGIGEQLKLAQCKEALRIGYDLITWTYDPLETVNANLNIKKLGGVCSTYIENYYGDMEDSLNAGIPSDRFYVDWWIQSDHVKDKVDRVDEKLPKYQEDLAVIKVNEREKEYPVPEEVNTNLTADYEILFVPVPGEFQKIKEEDFDLALEWRLQTRKVFTHYFKAGWQVSDFIRSDPKENVSPVYYYVLTKRGEDKTSQNK